MPLPARLTHVASGAFVIVYLTLQLGYPALAWVRPGYDAFTWHMYSGLHDRPTVAVIFADGTVRDLGLLSRRGSPVRVLGPSVEIERYAPKRVCALWPDAREVRVRSRTRDVTVPCLPRS
jgi:hypothetical protein